MEAKKGTNGSDVGSVRIVVATVFLFYFHSVHKLHDPCYDNCALTNLTFSPARGTFQTLVPVLFNLIQKEENRHYTTGLFLHFSTLVYHRWLLWAFSHGRLWAYGF